MESTRVEVEGEEVGRRLDRFLADQLAISRARVRHLLEVGRIRLAGRSLGVSDKSRPTRLAEAFEIDGPLLASDERPLPREDLPLEVVAEGAGWLVVDKPAGCGVHPLRPDQRDTVLNAVIARVPEILGVGEGGLRSGVVHRLDVETTGALVFATDEVDWKRLRGAFSEHRVEKRYLALVAGRFEASLHVDLLLAVKRHSPARVDVVASGGRRCRQRITPLRIFRAATLVEVDLETGFLHQIRASLAHLGHPILGDLDYGGTRGDGKSGSGQLDASDPLLHASRPLLHAARLVVDEIAASIDPPADFEATLAALAADEEGVSEP
jgi:23S rRNA pseudouridine1911/1915/1917 synthase